MGNNTNKLLENVFGSITGKAKGSIEDKIIEGIRKTYQEHEFKKKIEAYSDGYQKTVFESLTNQEAYDWQNLRDYVVAHYDGIIDCFLSARIKGRIRQRNNVYRDAYRHAGAVTDQQKKQVSKYLDGIMDIAEGELAKQSNDRLYDNQMAEDLKDVMEDNRDFITNELKSGMNEIGSKLTDVNHDIHIISEHLSNVPIAENHSQPDNIPKFLTWQPDDPRDTILHRKNQIAELLGEIRQTKHLRLLLEGFGGIGKTSVAKSLYHCLKEEYCHMAWIDCGDSLDDSLLNSFVMYQTIADRKIRLNAIKSFLNETDEHTLLLIDNYQEHHVDDLRFLAGIGAKVILTSRIADIKGFTKVPIPFLSQQECVNIFYQYYEYDSERHNQFIADQLVSLVRCHTLSVELLALAANNIEYDLAEYYQALVDKGFQYPQLKVVTGHTAKELTVSEHLRILFDMMTVSEPQQHILKNLTIMPDIIIPAEVRIWLGCDVNDLQKLCKLGWLSIVDKGYSMHKIIKDAILQQYHVEYKDCEEIMSYMAGDDYIRRTDHYSDARIRLEIAEAYLEKFKDLLSKEYSYLCNNIAILYQYHAFYEKALEWHGRALAITEKVLGKEHPNTAATYNNMALVYAEQGEYEKALEWYGRALAITEKVLGKEHPDTAATYNNMALVYAEQGEYEKALEWYGRALAITEKVLGKEHPETAKTYDNMANVYDEQGEYEKALEWCGRALAITEKVLGKEHPDTAATYNNMAIVYAEQGEYKKALEWYGRALAILEKTLGKNHVTTETVRNNMEIINSTKVT